MKKGLINERKKVCSFEQSRAEQSRAEQSRAEQSRAEQSRAEQSRAERNYGIDALRLVSMLMIVVIHILNQGGVSENTIGLKHNVSALMDVFVVCAVDIYAIVSGYVGYREDEQQLKSAKYLTMWMQVFFYSVGISLVARMFFPALINAESLFKSFFPVLTNRYWYFSAYTVVFFFAPWINKLLRIVDKSRLTKLVCLLIGLFSVMTVITYSIESDPFSLNKGYSAIWLLTLYIVGAWLKKNDVLQMMNKTGMLLLLAGVYIFTCGLKFVIPGLYGIVSYTSPTVLVMAALLVMLFSKIIFPTLCIRIIKFAAPASFGVYLIHVHPFVYNTILKDAFSWVADLPLVLFPIEIIGYALAIMASCLAIEKIRLYLFRIIGINRFASIAGNKIDCLMEKIFDSNTAKKEG